MSLSSRIIHRRDGRVHSDIQVVEDGNIRYMRFGTRGGWQGARNMFNPARPVFPYQRAFRSIVKVLPPPTSFLSFGVGTGTALSTLRKLHPETLLHGVDIDETVIELATEFFEAPDWDSASYFSGNGVDWMAHVNFKYDLIFVDAYMSDRVHSACVQPEFAKVLNRALTDNGTIVCNFITDCPPGGFIKRFLSVAKDYFPTALLLPVGVPYTEQNVLAVLRRDTPGTASFQDLRKVWARNMTRDRDLPVLERITWPLRLRYMV